MEYLLEKTSNHGSRLILSLLLYTLVLGSLLFSTSCQPSSVDSSRPLEPIQSDEPIIEPSPYPGNFDDSFRNATARFMPKYRWHWSKAQCYQESLLVPRAVSHAGAMGICQFMPGTWREVSERLGLNASVYNAKANILASSYYMGQLDRQWSSPRPDLDRLKLAQASYNAGLGTILKAQKACEGKNRWHEIRVCITWPEPKIYVKKIDFYYYDMTTTE